MRRLTLVVCAQPLQAGFCAVDVDQGRAIDVAMILGMDHPEGHVCCEGDDSGLDEVCESGPHCGSCFVGPLAIPSVSEIHLTRHGAGSVGGLGDLLPPSHSSPPFRPPIA